jgi:hypothetical protein
VGIRENLLRDVLAALIDRAREAKAAVGQSAPDTYEAGFAAGRAAAYYEVVSHVINQAEAFDVPRSAVGLPVGYSAEQDLL